MVQFFLGQHIPEDQLQDRTEMAFASFGDSRTVPVPVANEEENEESESHNSNSKLPSESSENEEQEPEPTREALLPWNYEGSKHTSPITALSNGAVGTRTGGAPLQKGTVRKKVQLFSQDPSHMSMRVAIPRKDLRREKKYSCKRCNSVDIESIGDTSTPGSKRKRGNGGKYKCKACGCLKMVKRVVPKPTPSPKKSLYFSPSSDSDSDVEYLEKKPKIKQEAPSPKPKSSVLTPQPQLSSPPLEDSIDHFGKYVTSLLRTVSSRRAFRLQKDVISLLLEDKMRESDQSD